ncbi:MAG: hypothetical protein IT557_10030 [Alphaproteobacteria bacterium]|nr:hypothetical protein [Alphaproteobacteria bacterium]
MVLGISAPSAARLLSDDEWPIVSRIFTTSHLPWRYRILVTNATGAGGAPFTIPTAALSALGLAATFGPIAGYLSSLTTLGYLMNVGSRNYPDMTASKQKKGLLVHETTHVWQGYNDIFALTYVISSAVSQCAAMVSADGSLASRNAAYNYTPGSSFGSYSAEQQASIVEDWFLAGEPSSGPLWRYIRDNIRRGRS